MYDILVYLFENYQPEACPEPEVLARKLSAAGFPDDEIDAALEWLAGLESLREADPFIKEPRPTSLRCYHEAELAKLPVDCRGYLAFLEQAGAIDTHVRERVLERTLALPEPVVSLSKFKIMVLMVMWREQLSLDVLVLEELLAEEGDEPVMH